MPYSRKPLKRQSNTRKVVDVKKDDDKSSTSLKNLAIELRKILRLFNQNPRKGFANDREI